MILPDQGSLLVSTDLHGHLGDFQRLRQLYDELRRERGDCHWAILGDVVHGPNPKSRQRLPLLYDYQDESGRLVSAIREAQRAAPERVHFVLGNHDYGHIGGPHTTKFYDDEVEHLEAQLTEQQSQDLQDLLSEAHLALLAPCGALLTHGAANDRMDSFAQLSEVSLPPSSLAEHHLIESLVTDYGQRREVNERVAAMLEAETGIEVSMNIHGHDRDVTGFYIEHDFGVLPCLFGAPDANKRVLVLDLSAQYSGPGDLREGHEIRRLYPELTPIAAENVWH